MKNEKKYELEFIITYNKKMYDSKNPNEYYMKLVKSDKYIHQNIFSLKLSKYDLLELLEIPTHFIEILYGTEKNFNDIWKVSLCVYQNGNDDLELPQWFNESNGNFIEIQKIHNHILKLKKEIINQ